MPKKLIVCADGTWNTESQCDEGYPCPTNVVKVARALLPTKKDGAQQLIHYERGVGSDFGIRVRGGGLGRGIFRNVVDCYRFLTHNYEPGDELCFFGFSRGAYTARSLSGLVRNSGILRRGHEAHEDDAIDLYRDYSRDTAPDGEKSVRFREAHSHNADILFLGVWDTVGALGIPGLDGRFRILRGLDWQFHDVALSTRVKHAFHALAIHEHRLEFEPTLWERQPQAPADQVLEQVWFSGVHADVGGGYKEAGLSDVALQWMVRKAEQHAGLEFDHNAFINFDPDPLAKGHDSFGTFYRVISWLRRHPGGKLREFGASQFRTNEDIHESVLKRFRGVADEEWPPSFQAELQKRSRG